MAGQILAGIRVLELGQLIAGPFAAKTLADFGAQVIKIEPPGQGDPLRKWRLLHEGTSVWWEAQSRNKQSVCVDLRQPEGQDLARQLAAQADVLIENFRPGTMEKWGLSWEALHALNPRLIMLRISGYGQTGPKAQEPGFAAIGEAMAGLRYLNGEPGRAPVRAGLSLGDTIAGLHGAMGVLLALYQRDARGGQGQVIDAALYESIFNLSESLLPEYSVFGAVREPAGAALPSSFQEGPSVAAPQGPVRVTQTHARHILIKTSTVMTDDQARQRLEQIRERLQGGAVKFEDMARQYSQDSTAPQGGDLGWVNPGDTVPPFEAAMNALQPNEISPPMLSPFGWHLIQVLERREHDVSDEVQRMRARQLLFERRAVPAFEDWLEQLRSQAFIDNRLEKQERLEQNNR